MDALQTFRSHIDASFNVMIVYPESSLYQDVKPQFEISGHAFLLHNQKTIVIDGKAVSEPWFLKEHLLVIQAHEVGHHLAGHAKHNGCSQLIEKEADWLGHKLLCQLDEVSAASLHRDEYHARYGLFPEDDKDIRKKIRKLV
tara:strand:+ start:20355 stop:20780 length:426 start_codon:yes stop_codon:yes gene_type:complete